MNKEARAIIAELDKKYIELDKTRNQLKASLDIQMLWPEAFKHGKCTSYLQGNLNKFESMFFQIKDGAGEIRDIQLIDLPDHLLKRAIEFQKRKANTWNITQLDKLYKHIQFKKRKEQLIHEKIHQE